CPSPSTAPSEEKLALALGADRYLKKPAPAATILATLKEAVAMTHLEPEHDAVREVEVLREYSDRLVSKWEERNIELEERLRQLMAADAELRDTHRKLETANANLM